jgi:hypothetical protein
VWRPARDQRGAAGHGWLTGIAAWALPLTLYVRTLAPTVYGVDSADLTTAAYLLGIAHPPGSPAYLLIGHAFTWLPIGDVGYRVNLLSAVAGALTSFFVYRIVARLSGDAWLGVATAWLIATSYYVWTAAVAAELYAPQGCVVAGLVALALRWRAAPQPWLFCALCLLAGVGLGLHLSLVLMLPGLALLVLAPPLPIRIRPTLLLAGALCGLLGSSVYLYLPIRFLSDLPLNPARDYWHVDLATWRGWWWMVSGAGFEGKLRSGAAAHSLGGEVALFAYRVWSNFLGLPALLGVVGVVVELRRRPWIHGALLLMLAGHVAFYLSYEALDKETMFVPAYLLWGIWIGLGARHAARWLAAALFGVADMPLLAPAALGCVVALLVLVNYRFADASADRSARERGETILATLEPNAVFVGAWADLRLVEYLQQVEGQRSDLVPDDAFFVPTAERAHRIATALQSGRPVYVTACRDLPDPNIRCEYESGCGCYRLRASESSVVGR